MFNYRKTVFISLRTLAATGVLAATAAFPSGMALGQNHPAAPNAPAPVVSERDLAATKEELIKLLKMSPTLTTVVARDPSLLANQDYVNRNNPQLGQFLAGHPEIVRNPEFYLFTRTDRNDGGPDQALEREVWPELVQERTSPSALENISNNLTPFLVFLCVLGAVIWLTRLFVENRRWNRIFKLQSDVHGRLIDKFGTNQDLLVYMDTEAGKRFLEASPIPVNFEPEQRVPNAVARVLTPLQIGIVLTLLGMGFHLMRSASPDLNIPMLVLGTLTLMPGIGFIISAGLTWILAGRLGLMPGNAARHAGTETDLRERP